jgi:hypothetical protein
VSVAREGSQINELYQGWALFPPSELDCRVALKLCRFASSDKSEWPEFRPGPIRNGRCFATCSQKVTDISDQIMLNSKRDSDVDQRTEHVMRSKLTELAWAAALAGAAVLATGTDASAYRWHRPPVVGIAAGSLIAAGIAAKQRWSPPGYQGQYLYDGYAGSPYDRWHYGAAEPRYYYAGSATAYVNAPYAYCLRRFGMYRYCR